MILLSGCINDKKETSKNTSLDNKSSIVNSNASQDINSAPGEEKGIASVAKAKPKTQNEIKEEKAIIKKVEENQKKFEEEQKEKAEAKRKASKYKNESCDKLIQKIENAVARAISDPDDDENMKFLYEINLDQTHADCKKEKEYNIKYQSLMKKWDES